VLQTTAGRMIFGRHSENGAAAEPAHRSAEKGDRDDSGRRPRPASQA